MTRSQPEPPLPPQPIEPPGVEKKMRPRPRYRAERYRGADKLLDRVALVTGGDSGIGRAVCVLFAREGADVAFTYLPVEQADAEETARAIESEGRRALAIPTDVRDKAQCAAAVERTVDSLGQLDIRAFELDDVRDQDIVVYCASGGRSARGAQALRDRGFRAVSLRGGMEAWNATS